MKNIVIGLALAAHAGIAGAQASTVAAPFRMEAYSGEQSAALSCAGHPAALSRLKRFSASLYSEQKFLLRELRTHTLALAMPAAGGGLGFTGSYSGFALYSEAQAGPAYGRRLGAGAGIGLQFIYRHRQTGGYGGASALGWKLDAVALIAPGLRAGIGASQYHPLGKSESPMKEPVMLTAGFGWDLSESCFIAAEIFKEEDRSAVVNAGIQYQFGKSILARCGISGQGFYLGGGLRRQHWRLEFSAFVHPYLGPSPSLVFGYEGGKAL